VSKPTRTPTGTDTPVLACDGSAWSPDWSLILPRQVAAAARRIFHEAPVALLRKSTTFRPWFRGCLA
jgi:hypothetical protein